MELPGTDCPCPREINVSEKKAWRPRCWKGWVRVEAQVSWERCLSHRHFTNPATPIAQMGKLRPAFHSAGPSEKKGGRYGAEGMSSRGGRRRGCGPCCVAWGLSSPGFLFLPTLPPYPQRREEASWLPFTGPPEAHSPSSLPTSQSPLGFPLPLLRKDRSQPDPELLPLTPGPGVGRGSLPAGGTWW